MGFMVLNEENFPSRAYKLKYVSFVYLKMGILFIPLVFSNMGAFQG